MIDRRRIFPQEYAGLGAGSPCSRQRPRSQGLPRAGGVLAGPPPGAGLIVRAPAVDLGLADPDFIPDRETPFVGTGNLPFSMGRSRSEGILKWKEPLNRSVVGEPAKYSTMDKMLKYRKQTDFEALVDILVHAIGPKRREDPRAFRQVHNPHRHLLPPTTTEDERRRKVLHALDRTPFCDIYELISSTEKSYLQLGRDLSLSHGDAKRSALDFVQQMTSPLDRASFWTAVGARSHAVDRKSAIAFPAGTHKAIGLSTGGGPSPLARGAVGASGAWEAERRILPPEPVLPRAVHQPLGPDKQPLGPPVMAGTPKPSPRGPRPPSGARGVRR